MLVVPDGRPLLQQIEVLAGAGDSMDRVAAKADPAQAFLRGAWFDGAGDGLRTLVANRADGSPLAALPLVPRRIGAFSAREVGGSYWPFRSIPIAGDARRDEVAALLRSRALRRHCGRVWRLGPAFATDPAVGALLSAAPAAGWTPLVRKLGTCFDIDVKAQRAAGPWPRTSTLQKTRWRERKLADRGPIEIRRFRGSDWTAADLEALTAVEASSWVARQPGAGLHFNDEVQRGRWLRAAQDPVIAPMIFGALLLIGQQPVALSFGLEVGPVRYQIVNLFDEAASLHSPGRVLLIREFEEAADRGIERISWGSGDGGYKSEIGASPGPDILDILFVRPPLLAAALRRRWKRNAA